MKTLLMVIGAIFAVLVIVLAVIQRIASDYRDGQSYADAAAVAIISDWNEQALLDRASPDFIKVTTRQQIDSWFAQLRGLGRMTKYVGCSGDTIIFPLTLTLTTTEAYVAKADFEHGSAQIKITLIKRNGAWRILGFYVHGEENQERSAKWRMPTYLLFRPYFA
jgi:hypothetical protein